ncbi:MAG: transposase [Clostridia bacterium]|nr:transposase [Clostridia bacterium]
MFYRNADNGSAFFRVLKLHFYRTKEYFLFFLRRLLTDPENKIVLDILPERYKPYLTRYFSKYSKEDLEKVKYFISDMWRTYYDTSGIWLKTQ